MDLPDYNKVTKWSIQDVINWLSVTRFHLDAELASAIFQKFLDKRQEAAVYIFKLSSSCVSKLREEEVDGRTLLNMTVQQLCSWNISPTDLRTILDFVGRIQGTSSSKQEKDHTDHRCSYNSLDAGSDSDWSEGSWSDPDFETEEINETTANTISYPHDKSFNSWNKPPKLDRSNTFSTLKKPPKPLPLLPSQTPQEQHYEQPDQRNSKPNVLQTFSSEIFNVKSTPAPPPVRPSQIEYHEQPVQRKLSYVGQTSSSDSFYVKSNPALPARPSEDGDYEQMDAKSTPQVQRHSKPNVLQTSTSKQVFKSYRSLPALPREEDYIQMDANNPPQVQRNSKTNVMQTAPSQRFVNSPPARPVKPSGEGDYLQMDTNPLPPVQRNSKPNVMQTSPSKRFDRSHPAPPAKSFGEDGYETPQQPIQKYSKPSGLQRSATFSANSFNTKLKPAFPAIPSEQQHYNYATSQNVKGHTWARRHTTRPSLPIPTPQIHEDGYLRQQRVVEPVASSAQTGEGPLHQLSPREAYMAEQSFYHGVISGNEGKARLMQHQKDGMYLVRKGTTTPNRPFSVIVYFQGQVYNLPIFINSSNNYIIGKTSKTDFKSVVALVNFYKRNPIEIKDRTKGTIQVKLKSSASKPK